MGSNAYLRECMDSWRQPELPEEVARLYELSGAEAYIDTVRRPEFGDGEISIEDTCAVVGVIVKFVPLQYDLGLYGYNTVVTNYTKRNERTETQKLSILVKNSLEPEQQRLVAGHEIGHHFFRNVARIYDAEEFRAGVDAVTLGNEEFFCEYFAHQLVVDRIPPLIGQLALFGEEL